MGRRFLDIRSLTNFFGDGKAAGLSDASRPYEENDLRSAVNSTCDYMSESSNLHVPVTYGMCPSSIVTPYTQQFGVHVIIYFGCHCDFLPICRGAFEAIVFERNLVYMRIHRDDIFLSPISFGWTILLTIKYLVKAHKQYTIRNFPSNAYEPQ